MLASIHMPTPAPPVNLAAESRFSEQFLVQRSAAGLDWRSDGQGWSGSPYFLIGSVAVDVDSTHQASYSEQPDEELLRLINEHDQLAFEALYDRHAGPVGGICLRRLRNPEVAAEITQDVFQQLWSGASRFEPGRAKFTTWLFTIVRNRCIDAARKVERTPISEQFEDTFADSSRPDPEAAAHSEQCRARLSEALASLPPAQREAVKLCVLEGYTHTEAAERLGEPLGTLKSRVKIGLEKLKSKMSAERMRT